ncbi:hypothetical protein TNCT_555981 [Trichonephila clavata]|uniref:Uncharacterized protein n=1 Tax=Trichonephila clavata TaxID=2740835 RepID=A0A8X6HS62_TRICU|nr:hypothetical protein TNCT_555981 [Trichonephila clavata]
MGSSQAIRSIPVERIRRLQFQWRRRLSHSSPKGVTKRDGGARASPEVSSTSTMRCQERETKRKQGGKKRRD